MDLFFLGNALLMFGAFALQFGMMGDDDEAATADPADPASNTGPVPLNDPVDYASQELGTAGNDVFDLAASPLGGAVLLGAGDDILDAGIDDDYAEGGAGNDQMSMRPGDDIALGGNGGADSLDSGDDNDVIYGNNAEAPGLVDDGNDTLSGGNGDDALHLAGGDQGTGGAGADSFMLYDPGDSGAVAQVTDYNADDDVIGVIYTPVTDPDTGDPVTPDVTVAASDDGTAGIVSLNGVEIAQITGGQSLTPADIALLPEETV